MGYTWVNCLNITVRMFEVNNETHNTIKNIEWMVDKNAIIVGTNFPWHFDATKKIENSNSKTRFRFCWLY